MCHQPLIFLLCSVRVIFVPNISPKVKISILRSQKNTFSQEVYVCMITCRTEIVSIIYWRGQSCVSSGGASPWSSHHTPAQGSIFLYLFVFFCIYLLKWKCTWQRSRSVFRFLSKLLASLLLWWLRMWKTAKLFKLSSSSLFRKDVQCARYQDPRSSGRWVCTWRKCCLLEGCLLVSS